MKFDMSGGAAVIEAMGAIAELGRAGHDHRRRAVHGEHAERPRGEARRHRHRDERQDDRDQQHRRRGPADPGRRALLRASSRAPSGSSTWPRSPARSSSRSARPTPGLFSNDDDWYARGRGGRRRHRRDRLADAAPPRVPRAHEGPVRRPDERLRAAHGQLDLRRRVPAPVRGRPAVGARGHRRHGVGQGRARTSGAAPPASACGCWSSWRSGPRTGPRS